MPLAADAPLTTAELDRAAAYLAKWSKYPPDALRDRSAALTHKAFDSGDGWACRLLTSVDTIAHFNLHASHLDVDPELAEPHRYADPEARRVWKAAILRHFKGPQRWRLALGKEGRVHVHVLADLADGPPDVPRGGQLAKPCESYYRKAVRYQLKPALERTALHLAVHFRTKKRWKLPAAAGSRGVPNRRTWGNASSSGFSLLLSPPCRSRP